MTKPTEERLIFHITHIDNLPAILAEGCLWSDFQVLKRTNQRTVIGFDTIKKRRLEELPVSCHPNMYVGHFVPFYFCPRSPMLYVIHRRNAELSYHGGQDRIVHLVSQIGTAIEVSNGKPWAFSDGNAGARYTRFSNDLARIDELVDWNAVGALDWRDPTVKERKQAEFLVHEQFPWEGILAVGTTNQAIADEVQHLLSPHQHRPQVIVKQGWYY